MFFFLARHGARCVNPTYHASSLDILTWTNTWAQTKQQFSPEFWGYIPKSVCKRINKPTNKMSMSHYCVGRLLLSLLHLFAICLGSTMEMKRAIELNFLRVCRSCCKSLGPPTDLLDLPVYDIYTLKLCLFSLFVGLESSGLRLQGSGMPSWRTKQTWKRLQY